MNTVKLESIQIERLKNKYPNRLPVIVTRANYSSKDLPFLSKNKYLVPNDITIGAFVYIIRKNLNLRPEVALFVLVGNTLPTTSTSMGELYDLYKTEDGVLYISYTSENTFG
jgi:GABA(A) receptor-associated protein